MTKPLRAISPLLVVLLAVCPILFSGCTEIPQDPYVDYSVTFPNLVQHEARVMATFSGLRPGVPLELRMSRTSPGRYSLHEFVKNVYDVEFKDGTGNLVAARKSDPHGWVVDHHDGTVTVNYTVFGDRADGTYNGFDRTFAHVNMPATFMWARGMPKAPVSIKFLIPRPNWKIATQLFPTEDPERFTAPDLAYFMDSPVRIAPIKWFVRMQGKREAAQEIRIALQHDGTPNAASRWAENIWKIVDEQVEVFGEAPRYDGLSYTFLAAFLPNVFRDGMEHRNSTVVTHTDPLDEEGKANLGTMAHEFFHQWNVERIRPETLEPFNFEAANPSDALWLAEGFTNYYQALSIRRAGITSNEEFADQLSGPIQSVLLSPARTRRSAVEMSEWAVFADRGVFGDRVNMSNTFLSYYTWGSVIGLSLDLTLRAKFESSLDEYMRLMWMKYGKKEIPYSMADARQTLEELTGKPAFAEAFFNRFIYGTEVPGLEALLQEAGFVLRRKNGDSAFLGGTFTEGENGLELSKAGPEGSPVYKAGLDEGDVLISINGDPVSTEAGLNRLLAGARMGTIWEVVIRTRGILVTTEIILKDDPSFELVTMESLGMELPESAAEFRTAWIK